MLTMNLEGLEMIAVLVVVVLFVKVLDRFGLLAASYDGKEALMSGRLFLGGGGDHLLLKLLAGQHPSFCPLRWRCFKIRRFSLLFVLPPVTDGRFIRKTRESPAANWLRVTHAKQIDNPA